MHHTINVLWTGGWDSTFRVLYASLVEGMFVIPHYIVDMGRRSSLHELQAIAHVREALRRIDDNAAERIGALAITPITDIPDDAQATVAYQQMSSIAPLGSQFEWLARYARSRGLKGLELSVDVDDKAYPFLEGKVRAIASGGWVLRDEVAGNEKTLFSRFHFPLLELSKPQMRSLAQQHGFLDVLEQSWFCFQPIHGKPCGVCHPCCDAVEEGMGYRLPREAMLRHRLRFLRKALRGPVVSSRRGWVAQALHRHS